MQTSVRKDRKPWIAGILALSLPGLGHWYLGRLALSISWFFTVEILITAATLLLRSPLLPPVIGLGAFVIPFVAIVLSARAAVRLSRQVRATYEVGLWNKWYVYLLVLAIGATLQSLFSDARHEYIAKAYRIPSPAMVPTLLIGDHVFVDKLIYRLGTAPRNGDIIVFRFPEDERKDFIKRVVALPGDSVEVRNKQLIVNGEQINDVGYTQRIDPNMIEASVNPRDNFGPVTVPDHAYFVLGDNRDQSLDSRFWGYVSADKIRGKVMFIYWSWKGTGAWNEWIRWDRIGQRIE